MSEQPQDAFNVGWVVGFVIGMIIGVLLQSVICGTIIVIYYLCQ